MRRLQIAAALAASLFAGAAHAQSAGWLSYRDAYHALARFERYTQPKDLIQIHYQVTARDGSTSMGGLHLTLASGAGAVSLPLDEAGRTVLPLAKQPYDENAVITYERPFGLTAFPRVSIIPAADGRYTGATLR
ncbi:MAG TPA: hypothetical protein VIT92_11610, partial [Burkholderiaceae bacterium]